MSVKSVAILAMTLAFLISAIIKATVDNLYILPEPMVQGYIGLLIDMLIILMPIIGAILITLEYRTEPQEQEPEYYLGSRSMFTDPAQQADFEAFAKELLERM
jgi:hypothetical protein